MFTKTCTHRGGTGMNLCVFFKTIKISLYCNAGPGLFSFASNASKLSVWNCIRSAFNFFTWSLGCLIYSEDKSYISPKKMFINPATIPIYIGVLLFLLPINQYVPEVVHNALNMFSNIVAPISMMLIGMLLADVKLKTAFADRYLWEALAVRLLVFPALIWGIVWLVSLTGLYNSEIATAVTLICAATPSAAATGMFATKFGCDTQTASKFVSISTIFSVLTMPIVALLLQI